MIDPACHAPFVSMEFDPSGNVFTCCANQLYPMGNVADGTLADIWRGPRAHALRAALADGDLTLGCNSCHWAMAHGNDASIARLYDAFPVASANPDRPSRMTFALSNRCNLECVMCNGELSSKIRAREGRPPLPPVYHDDFFAQLDQFLPHLSHASFLGGEPFLIAENYRVWEQMSGLAITTRCAVVTNATRFDAKVEAVLAALAFDVTVSLDGVTAATVEGIRRNIGFAEALDNAERFRAYTDRSGTAFGFNFCLMRHNWTELGAFLAFADGWDADVRVISVSEPGHSLHDLDEAPLAHVLAGLEAEARAHQRITRWAHGGPVARLLVGADRLVRSVDHGQEDRTGVVGGDAIGADIDDVLRRTEVAIGREFYAVERWAEDGVVDQTFLATTGVPARGGAGSVLRVISAAVPGGAVSFVAADRFYDRGRPVEVRPRG